MFSDFLKEFPKWLVVAMGASALSGIAITGLIITLLWKLIDKL